MTKNANYNFTQDINAVNIFSQLLKDKTIIQANKIYQFVVLYVKSRYENI